MEVQFNDATYATLNNELHKVTEGGWELIKKFDGDIVAMKQLNDHLYVAIDKG